jgi:hypothetical protein
MDNLVERLRALKWKVHCEMRGLIDDTTAYEAADELTRLTAENARLRGLIEPTEANVERVARAVWGRENALGHWDGTTGNRWTAFMIDRKPYYRGLATAALTAMGDV